ncbi:MAG: NAD-dependent epimerase/dehydratase family protein [Pseudomonadota bacterium]
MKIVITGATGYIGSRLTALALERGHDVILASRRDPCIPNVQWFYFELSSIVPVELPPQTHAIIHLAANTSSSHSVDDEAELFAARSLLAASQHVEAKFIFVSSQTSRPNAPTMYGRNKWRIEQAVISSGGWVVRPGQVYGGCVQGLFGTLVVATRRHPILPKFLPAPHIQPVHVDDFAIGLLRIVENDIPAGIYCLGSPKSVDFADFLEAIAKFRVRRFRLFVPIPVFIVKLAGSIRSHPAKSPSNIDRLISLLELPLMDTAADIELLELSLRPLPDGMHASGSIRRRCLLREGHAFLCYLLKTAPTFSLLRRYVRTVERLRDGLPLALPELFLRYPFFMPLIENHTSTSSRYLDEFNWRLDAVTLLAEATPQGAIRFLGSGSKFGIGISLLCITRAISGEIFWRLLCFISSPILKRWGRRREGEQ